MKNLMISDMLGLTGTGNFGMLAPPNSAPHKVTITAAPPHTGSGETMSIGDINTRIDGLQGFKVSRDFLEELGFHGVAVGVRHMYLAADFQDIVAAIADYLRSVK